MVTIQPELWVDDGPAAVAFYQRAFGATVRHLVGDGTDIVAQLDVRGAAFWIATAGGDRVTPRACSQSTSRTMLVVDDPDELATQAVAAGATLISPVADEHGWRVGRIIDPSGHEWEIARAPAR